MSALENEIKPIKYERGVLSHEQFGLGVNGKRPKGQSEQGCLNTIDGDLRAS